MGKKYKQISIGITEEMNELIRESSKKYNSKTIQEEIRILLSEGLKFREIQKTRSLKPVTCLILERKISFKNLSKITSERYYQKIISDNGSVKNLPIYEYEDKLYTHVDF